MKENKKTNASIEKIGQLQQAQLDVLSKIQKLCGVRVGLVAQEKVETRKYNTHKAKEMGLRVGCDVMTLNGKAQVQEIMDEIYPRTLLPVITVFEYTSTGKLKKECHRASDSYTVVKRTPNAENNCEGNGL